MTYIFRYDLLLQIHTILGVTKKIIMQGCNGNPATFTYWCKSGSIPFQSLIDICNGIRVPLSYFIEPDDGTHVLLTRSDYLVQDRPWIPIENKMQDFGGEYVMATNMTNEQAAEACGMSTSYFYKCFVRKEEVKMRTSDFVKMINTSKQYPGQWAIDNNRPIAKIKGYGYIADLKPSTPDAQIRQLKGKVSVLEARVTKLETLVEQLLAHSGDVSYSALAAEEDAK